jgi:hypothetical protein
MVGASCSIDRLFLRDWGGHDVGCFMLGHQDLSFFRFTNSLFGCCCINSGEVKVDKSAEANLIAPLVAGGICVGVLLLGS